MNNEIEEIRKKFCGLLDQWAEVVDEALDGFEQQAARIKELEVPVRANDEWPKVGDTYWCGAKSRECAVRLVCAEDVHDAFFKAIGDMHRTKEEAEAYRAYRMNPRTVMRDKIQMFVDGYNGDWVRERGGFTITAVGGVAETIVITPLVMRDVKGVALLREKFGIDNILWACGGPAPGGE